jgi:hypothetical protein
VLCQASRRLVIVDGFAHDMGHVNCRRHNSELADLGAEQLEQVSDEGEQRSNAIPDARHAVPLSLRQDADDPVLEQRRVSVDRIQRVLQIVANTSHEARLAFHRPLDGASATLSGCGVLLQTHPEPDHCPERRERGDAEGDTELTSPALSVEDLLAALSGRSFEDIIELCRCHQHILVQLTLKRIGHGPTGCARGDSFLHKHVPALLERPKDVVLLLHSGTEPSRQSREALGRSGLTPSCLTIALEEEGIARVEEIVKNRAFEREGKLNFRHQASTRLSDGSHFLMEGLCIPIDADRNEDERRDGKDDERQ